MSKNYTKNGHSVQINKRLVPIEDEEGNPISVLWYDWDISVPPGKVVGAGSSLSLEEAKAEAFSLIPDEE